MSKELEALNELERFVNEDIGIKGHKESGWHLADKPEFHLIKSALEILEIIKMYSFIQNNYKEDYGTFTQFLCNIHTIGMKEDFEKVKEWLKND